MKFDTKLYKNSWYLYRKEFGKLTAFSFSLFLLVILCIVCWYFVSSIDLGISAILIFIFGIFPLFFSFEVVIAKVSAGQSISYNDFYANYKSYFLPNNRGSFSILINVLLTFLMNYLFIALFIGLYYLIFKDNVMEVINSLPSSGNIMDEATINEIFNQIINLDYFLYFYLGSIICTIIFFLWRIKKSIMVPYFTLMAPQISLMSVKFSKMIAKNKRKEIFSKTFLPDLCFFLMFFIGCIVGGVIGILLADYLTYIETIVVIALSCGFIFSIFFFPPLVITYCFIADGLYKDYLNIAKKEMIKVEVDIDKLPGLDDDKKAQLKKLIDNMKKEVEKKDESNDDSSKNN